MMKTIRQGIAVKGLSASAGLFMLVPGVTDASVWMLLPGTSCYLLPCTRRVRSRCVDVNDPPRVRVLSLACLRSPLSILSVRDALSARVFEDH